MDDRYQENMDNLNNEDVHIRLHSLEQLADGFSKNDTHRPAPSDDVNNHIHTFYSFSPYSPTKALWMAYNAGLGTAGIMDHDSISGAREFIRAGEILGMATTIGLECRVDFSGTALRGRRINNPDQKSVAYMAMHGIPHTQIDAIQAFFVPFSLERNRRNRQMTDKINQIIEPFEMSLDFEQDVLAISKYNEGGSVTERHILFGLSGKLIKKFGKGRRLVDFLHQELQISVSGRNGQYLLDESNPYYDYDLLGTLKSNMIEKFYIDAKEECPDVRDVITLCREKGAIAAYAYLGDIGDSVTGDKKSQKFEDDYIEELFGTIKTLGFNAVTYMPSRNTSEQLRLVKTLCEKYELFQISGEDINSPRQNFVCEAMRDTAFRNLVDSTWALIGHEKTATLDLGKGMFSEKIIQEHPSLHERIQIFKELGCRQYKRGDDKC